MSRNSPESTKVFSVKGYFDSWVTFDKMPSCPEDLLTMESAKQFEVDPADYLAFREALADSFDLGLPPLGTTKNIPGCEVGDTKMLLIVEIEEGWESMAVLGHDVVTMDGGFARLDRKSQSLFREMLPAHIADGLFPIVGPKLKAMMHDWLHLERENREGVDLELSQETDVQLARQIINAQDDPELQLEFEELLAFLQPESNSGNGLNENVPQSSSKQEP